MNLYYIVFIVFFLFLFKKTWAADWSYRDQETWSKSCTGDRQSPIDIDEIALEFKNFAPLQFINYSDSYQANIINNGHSVEITLDNTTTIPMISGGGLSGTYVFNSLHLHWEAEHTVNKRRYPLEIHLVHHAQKYGNLANALNYKDGVAVLGVFFDTTHKMNKAIHAIASSVVKIKKNLNKPVHVKSNLRLIELLPDKVDDFYFYEGSLTTPNCNEAVLWTILSNPASLTKHELKKLSGINGEDNAPLRTNFRELQPLNGRTVYTNNPEYSSVSAE